MKRPLMEFGLIVAEGWVLDEEKFGKFLLRKEKQYINEKYYDKEDYWYEINKVTNWLLHLITDKYQKEVSRIKNHKALIKNDLVKLNENETKKSALEWCDNYLKTIDINNFNINLRDITEGKYLKILWTNDIIDLISKSKFIQKKQELEKLKDELLLVADDIKKESKDNQSITNNDNNLIPSKRELFELQCAFNPKIQLVDVHSHFMLLTQLHDKKGVYYLTEEQVLRFIFYSFYKMTPQKQSFRTKITRIKVREIFYDFYFRNRNFEKNNKGLKEKYYNLLSEGFEGFQNDSTDFDDFHKRQKR